LNFRVENTLKGDGTEMSVQLKFDSMEDFAPANVAKQVEPLRRLLETRDKLRDLMTKVDRSDDLESVLEKVLQNSDELQRLSSELGLGEAGGGAASLSDGEPSDQENKPEGAE
jgi:type VI secretion system protein ImpB